MSSATGCPEMSLAQPASNGEPIGVRAAGISSGHDERLDRFDAVLGANTTLVLQVFKADLVFGVATHRCSVLAGPAGARAMRDRDRRVAGLRWRRRRRVRELHPV